MADYLTQLRRASFRGIQFDCPENESGGGRRVVRHDYPGKDQPTFEDLGLDSQSFTVTAIINGDGFAKLADTFEAALQKSGPGTLIHPLYGQLQVIVTGRWRRSSSAATVGDVTFSIPFERYNGPVYPSAAADTVAGLSAAGDNLAAAVTAEFKAAFDANVPDFLSTDALGRANSFITGLSSSLSQAGLKNPLSIALPVLSDISGGLSDTILALYDSISAAAQPKAVPVVGAATADQLTGAQVTQLAGVMSQVSTSSIADTTTAATATAATRQKNALALDNILRAGALAAATTMAQYAAYDSKEQARALRDDLAANISTLRDQLGASRGWDNSWLAAGQALAAITRDINDRIGRLPRTQQVKTTTTRTSLDIAQRLYGDDPKVIFAKADDIVARNGIRHPGFVPPSTLEALIDAA
ncbi:MAG: hypothetical protein GC185_01900 [Alphaproteobacteria bacterium]|nr:hypothetical protein [Alphaproteobacteria bacterium]